VELGVIVGFFEIKEEKTQHPTKMADMFKMVARGSISRSQTLFNQNCRKVEI
jgi:hypothetical protein